MVALNRNASGASARMKISRVPCSPGWWSLTHTPNDPCACASASAAASGSHCEPARGDDRLDASPRQRVGIFGDPAVHHRHGGFAQVAGGVGGLAADPRLDLTRTDPCPQRGSRWRRSNASATSRSAAWRGGGEHDAELGRCELRHARCAGAAEPDQLLTAGQQRARGPGELTVQVGPVRGGLQQPDLALLDDRAGLLGGGQGGQLVECAEVGVEHVFDSTCHVRQSPDRFALSTRVSRVSTSLSSDSPAGSTAETELHRRRRALGSRVIQRVQPTSTGSGCSSIPNRDRTPSRTSAASASRSAVRASPRLVKASVCLVDRLARALP